MDPIVVGGKLQNQGPMKVNRRMKLTELTEMDGETVCTDVQDYILRALHQTSSSIHDNCLQRMVSGSHLSAPFLC
jgi:hypothetical protein